MLVCPTEDLGLGTGWSPLSDAFYPFWPALCHGNQEKRIFQEDSAYSNRLASTQRPEVTSPSYLGARRPLVTFLQGLTSNSFIYLRFSLKINIVLFCSLKICIIGISG